MSRVEENDQQMPKNVSGPKKNKVRNRRKGRILLIISVLFLVSGACVIFYPQASKYFDQIEQNAIIEEFDRHIDSIGPEHGTDGDAGESPGNHRTNNSGNGQKRNWEYDSKLLAQLYSDMLQYNKTLYETGQVLVDPFCYAQESFDLRRYSVYDNIFGYISAPSIGLNMVVYLGASTSNMWLGAAHMTGTSMPIGGDNTNAVIAGHSAVIGRTMFDNIVRLEVGARVYMRNLWERLQYKVVETDVIKPEDSDKIKIQPGRDMLTMITCYPYGYNTHRYVVYCERVA